MVSVGEQAKVLLPDENLTDERTVSGRLAIEAARLSKAYGRTRALRDVSLQVDQGETVALLGPNGAGKTTLMQLLATLTKPTGGSLRLLGVDPWKHLQAVRRRIGVVGHKPFLYDDLTARENLEFYARLYGLRDAVTRYDPLLQEVGLARVADAPVRSYSRGMQQRLALVRALLHDPALLLLDEPDAGLDQDALGFLDRVLQSHGGKARTVLFSTHNLELGLRLAERVVVLGTGTVVYDAPTTTLDAAGLRDTYRELAGAVTNAVRGS